MYWFGYVRDVGESFIFAIGAWLLLGIAVGTHSLARYLDQRKGQVNSRKS